MSKTKDSGRMHHTKVTGNALQTANRHTKDEEVTFFGASYCPYTARVWTALEYLEIPYRFLEVDPYSKPPELLEVSPRGLMPGLKLNNNGNPLGLNESMVIVDYLEALSAQHGEKRLLPPASDPYAQALVKLAADHVNRTLVPSFYKFWIEQDPELQKQRGVEFTAAIEGLIKLLERQDKEIKVHKYGSGLWREGGELNFVDVVAAPFLFRSKLCIEYYRDWKFPDEPRFKAYTEKLFEHPAFKAVCSSDQLYIDSDEQYAFNRAHSQVSQAINSGKALP